MVAARRLLVADDHPLISNGIQLAVHARIPDIAIDTTTTIAGARALIAAHGGYDLVLLDFRLPDARGFSGFFELQQDLGNRPIAIISASDDTTLVAAARAVGASGFLSKADSLDALVGAVGALLAGERVFPPVDSGALDSLQMRLATLSASQRRVLVALVEGRLNKQIAGDLNVTEATVKAHLTAIFRKIGVQNRVQAILTMQPLLNPQHSL
ncbi:response regulator transcription factor [Sphingomonas sp. GC_Shp_3]|uniref:response regulator transcription factor n=1 Tax=Sphingomonas sp. GC_Shp_3 TaxID=2937383 RepID=UPI0022698E8E|nr:response regulator transcription factor [Sphingomonas sp. GC_Shp_3]